MKVHYNSGYVRKYDHLWDLQESLYHPQLKLYLEKMKIKQNLHILDVGCGVGHHTLFLENFFDGETIGLDCSIEMLKQIQKPH